MKLLDTIRSIRANAHDSQDVQDAPENDTETADKSLEVSFSLSALDNHQLILSQVLRTRTMHLKGGRNGVISMEQREQELHDKVSAQEIKDACGALRVEVPEFVTLAEAEALKNSEVATREDSLASGIGASATSDIATTEQSKN